VQYLREKWVRSVRAVSSSGRLTGVVPQSNISDKVAAENKRTAWMKISEIMARGLIPVKTEKTFEDRLRLMVRNSIFQLMVLDDWLGFRGLAFRHGPLSSRCLRRKG